MRWLRLRGGWRAVVVLWLCTVVALPAHAVPERGMDPSTPLSEDTEGQNPIPKHRLFYSNALFARVNPLGLIDAMTLGWRYRLLERDDLLFNDTYLMLGLSSRASPAFGRVGGYAEINPIAVWKAWAAVEGVGYFGTFDQITGFDTPDAVYDDRTLRDLGEGRAMLGWVATIGTVLQAKVGPIALRSTFQATRYDLQLDDGDLFFYDQYWDRLAPNRRFMFANDLDLLGLIGNTRVGARWTWTDAIAGDNDSHAGQAQHRVGPLFAYQFHDRGPGARFDKPTLFVLAQWWAQHPYRTGAEQPGALPLIAIGFAFQGDLIGPKPPGRR